MTLRIVNIFLVMKLTYYLDAIVVVSNAKNALSDEKFKHIII